MLPVMKLESDLRKEHRHGNKLTYGSVIDPCYSHGPSDTTVSVRHHTCTTRTARIQTPNFPHYLAQAILRHVKYFMVKVRRPEKDLLSNILSVKLKTVRVTGCSMER